MAAVYKTHSPYYGTQRYGNFLDVLTFRNVPRRDSDTIYVIDDVYQYRPDLLANDLYGNPGLWWVFAARNPNTIQDPVYDFVIGKSIYVPNQQDLTNSLGI
jgi:hypothetical protein